STTFGSFVVFFFRAEDGIRDFHVTGVQTCALPIFACRRGGIGAGAAVPTCRSRYGRHGADTVATEPIPPRAMRIPPGGELLGRRTEERRGGGRGEDGRAGRRQATAGGREGQNQALE